MERPQRVPFTLKHYFRVVRFEWKLDRQFGWPWYRRIFRMWWYGYKRVWYDKRTSQMRLPATNAWIASYREGHCDGIIFDPNAPAIIVTHRSITWKPKEKKDAK